MTEETKQSADKLNTTAGELDSLGNFLKSERLRQGKSLEDVSAATRISIVNLQALESDARHKLPRDVFVRGYIKQYATYLTLDAAEVLDRYESTDRELKIVGEEIKETGKVLSAETLAEEPLFFGTRQILSAIFLVLLCILGYLVYKTYYQTPPQVKTETNDILELERALSRDLENAELRKQQIITIEAVKDKKQPAPEDPASIETPATTTILKKPVEIPEKDETITVKAKIPLPEMSPESSAVIPPIEDESPPLPQVIALPVPVASEPQSEPDTVIVIPLDSEPAAVYFEDPQKDRDEGIIIETIAPEPSVLNLPQVFEESGPAYTSASGENISAAPPLEPYKYVIRTFFTKRTVFKITLDNGPSKEYRFQSGDERIFKARQQVEIEIDDAAGAAILLNDSPMDLSKTEKPALLKIPADSPE
ncbi:MAG: helix-turn-helix domain-containing protein [Proteobacteria bacterium]|nr:helix-turn-helix domain-containing protein [Pseudomonadota bacterium]MBU1710348.1 helix-turn-helix domain-containing protein [Pseudomonadota bacterium]